MKNLVIGILSIALTACGGGGGGGGSNGAANTSNLNTIVIGEVLAFANGQGHRGTSSCRGLVCTLTLLGESATGAVTSLDLNSPIPSVGPITSRNGVKTARVQFSEADSVLDSYGVWGDYNRGTPGTGRLPEYSIDFAVPISVGYSTGTNPTSGSATWQGAMVGNTYTGSTLGDPVIGDTTLTADFGASTVDVAITSIAERQTGRAHGDMRWSGLSMNGGAFGASGINGRFYGPNHEEAGGVIDKNGIIGAFSTKR